LLQFYDNLCAVSVFSFFHFALHFAMIDCTLKENSKLKEYPPKRMLPETRQMLIEKFAQPHRKRR
jgi:hypothetical protein